MWVIFHGNFSSHYTPPETNMSPEKLVVAMLSPFLLYPFVFCPFWKGHSLVLKLKKLHPGRLTWNLKITQLKRKIIFQTIILRFHVNLPGCILSKICISKTLPLPTFSAAKKKAKLQWRLAPPPILLAVLFALGRIPGSAPWEVRPGQLRHFEHNKWVCLVGKWEVWLENDFRPFNFCDF